MSAAMQALPPAIGQTLRSLADQPPQTLLIEGGTGETRLQTALLWASVLNCDRNTAKEGACQMPCDTCGPCRQISALEYGDLFIYDGRIPNKQDDEKPGLIRALRMERMRELKSLVAEFPRGRGKRVAIFQGLSQTREEAMNSLLKTLEEPSRFTVFTLLTPFRGQLLPTLVSRSICLTLPWQGSMATMTAQNEWLEAMTHFLTDGASLLDKTGSKNSLDLATATEILSCFQGSLARSMCGRATQAPLDQILLKFQQRPWHAFEITNWINEAQNMLSASVNPARVIEAFATRVFWLLKTPQHLADAQASKNRTAK